MSEPAANAPASPTTMTATAYLALSAPLDGARNFHAPVFDVPVVAPARVPRPRPVGLTSPVSEPSPQPPTPDDDLWHRAYHEHAAVVLGFLRRRLGGRDEAEDLLQETFVRAIRAGTYDESGNLRSYLLTIAKNLLVNRLRRPRVVVEAPEGREEGSSFFDGVADGGLSPEEGAAYRGFRRELGQVLETLSDAHRTAFVLGVLEGRSYREVAEHTGWSTGRVKVNVHRARKKILAELGDLVSLVGGPR